MLKTTLIFTAGLLTGFAAGVTWLHMENGQPPSKETVRRGRRSQTDIWQGHRARFQRR